MELADAHVHFFRDGYRTRYGVFFPEGRELEIYQAFRAAHQIGEVLAVGYEGGSHEGNNRYLGEVAARHPWVHPIAYCPPEQPPTEAQLAGWRRQRFVGISLYVPCPELAEALLTWPPGLLAALNEWRALVGINIPGILLPVVRPLLEKLDGCRILISHLGLFGGLGEGEGVEKLRPLTALAALPHLGVKASAFYACEPFYAFPHRPSHAVFAAMLDAFGPHRLYWGSDFSPALEFVSFAQTVEMLGRFDLGDEARNAIGGGNLRRLLTSQH